MRFEPAGILGAYRLELERHEDERGYFARALCERELSELGLWTHFPQCNVSFNRAAFTLRGMHYEAGPSQEVKVVRCISGAIFDAIVDLRPDSATRWQWFGLELSADNAQALYIPAGCAHGFLTLRPDTSVYYHMGDFYRPQAARGFRYDDPRFAISWPERPRVISERDVSYPFFDPAGHSG
jgi:dTDP-4-dehydrorhamnose 3,5-epimerase